MISSLSVQAMWFLVHCYEDQGKLDAALDICEDLLRLVHDFGGEGLGQKHKFWQLLLEKRDYLLHIRGGEDTISVVDAVDDVSELPPGLLQDSPAVIPPKMVIKNFTY